jgi:hypothetical protein
MDLMWLRFPPCTLLACSRRENLMGLSGALLVVMVITMVADEADINGAE